MGKNNNKSKQIFNSKVASFQNLIFPKENNLPNIRKW